MGDPDRIASNKGNAMRIATFNCNSIRQRMPIVLDWMKENAPDALALQETKARDEDFPAAPLREAGWHVAYRGEKSYNGVAVITREEPEAVSFGLEDDGGQSETRLVRVRLRGVEIVNTYVPQGKALDSEKFAFKLAWLERLRSYFEERFSPGTDKVAWVGDCNVAPTAADVHDAKKVGRHVCFCEEVSEAFAHVTDWGFEDVFSKHLPEPGTFTFWDYRVRNALERNVGWRIDHVLATPPLAGLSTGCRVDLEPRRREKPSDHTFVVADFDP